MITFGRRRSEWCDPTPPARLLPPNQLSFDDDGCNWSKRCGSGHKRVMEKVADFFLPRGVVAQRFSGRMFTILLWERRLSRDYSSAEKSAPEGVSLSK